jgi:hypothetical protein
VVGCWFIKNRESTRPSAINSMPSMDSVCSRTGTVCRRVFVFVGQKGSSKKIKRVRWVGVCKKWPRMGRLGSRPESMARCMHGDRSADGRVGASSPKRGEGGCARIKDGARRTEEWVGWAGWAALSGGGGRKDLRWRSPEDPPVPKLGVVEEGGRRRESSR